MGVPPIVRRIYLRLGHRYPRVALVAQFQLTHLVVLGGVGLLTLYQRMSDTRFLTIVLVAEGLVVIENVISITLAFRLVAPSEPWLAGDHGPQAAAAAWRALAGLPLDFIRRLRLVTMVADLIPIAAFITLELRLPWYGFPVLVAGSAVVLAYGWILRFFVMELSMRPVLEDISRDLEGRVEIGSLLPLRWKLLAALPAINIITGVVVSGLAKGGHASLSDLGINVLLAVAVAFTLSLELTVLLSRSVLGPIQELRQATQRVTRGDFGARVAVISTDETGALASSFNQMVAGLEERERLHEAFGAFVDPVLADRVVEEGAELEGEDVEVTVLFLDIRGFTAFAERSSAREVVAALNDFYEKVVPALTRHGGHANKFIGDGLLGVFGAPERRSDHADRAVAAAREILEIIERESGRLLEIGIGINSGPVVAGTIGGGGRLEFTVIGDAVNTAARVEAVTRETGDRLLITEATRCLLERDGGEWVRRPRVALKGKTEQVELYAPAEGGEVEGVGGIGAPTAEQGPVADARR